MHPVNVQLKELSLKTIFTILVLFLCAGSVRADEPRFVVNPRGEFLLVADPAPKAKCTYCTDCVCKDGDCPSKCAVSNYAAVYARVQRGERVTVTVGPGGFNLAGVAPGTYDCYLDASGRQMMQARQVVQVVTAAVPVGYGFPQQNCPNGRCPLQR